MAGLFDMNAPKKATNLSINSDLLAKSKALNINLSAALEEALERRLAAEKHEKWAKQNSRAIKAYNEFVETHGYFGEEYRAF